MRAVVVERPDASTVETVDDPTPGPRRSWWPVAGAASAAPTSTSWTASSRRRPTRSSPGHEFAGKVVAVGTAVTEFAVGDRVAVDPSLYCGECHYCCDRPRQPVRALGRDRRDRAPAARPSSSPRRWRTASRCPTTCRSTDAALIEPLSCAVHGFDVLPGRVGRPLPDLRRRHDGPDDGCSWPSAPARRVSRRRPQRGPAGDRPRRLGCRRAVALAPTSSTGRTAGTWSIDCTGAVAGDRGRPHPGRPRRHVPAFGVPRPTPRRASRRSRSTTSEITIIGSHGGAAQLRPRRRPDGQGRHRRRRADQPPVSRLTDYAEAMRRFPGAAAGRKLRSAAGRTRPSA